MRNLLGRLHARPPDDLARIAAAWRVPLGTGPRPARVAALYRVMTDPRAARAFWDGLDVDGRALIRILAVADGDGGMRSLADLAHCLDRSETKVREAAAALYRAGVIAREGDDDPLPVGAAPRIFLPRELALLFRRIEDELEVGDRSGDRLATLLEWLDDGELEGAAARWGVATLPGLGRREEVAARLLRQMADPERIAATAARLRADAGRLWRRVRDEPGGRPVPLAVAAADVGLVGETAPAAQRLRAALADLEASLLVWHTYRPDGSRWLFVPEEVRSPRPPAPPAPPPLDPLPKEAVAEPRWRHPDALAWDLLTLLHAVGRPEAAAWPVEGPPPRAEVKALDGRLWQGGDGADRYVRFLVALAESSGLLVPNLDRHAARLDPVATFRRWRERPFPRLLAALRQTWLDQPAWVEGAGEDRVEVRGVDWPSARRRLLDHLVDGDVGIERGEWYPIDALAERIAMGDPELLGSTFSAATARMAGEAGAGVDKGDARRAAIAEVVAIELRGALRWFGVVDVSTAPGGAVVRLPRRAAEADGEAAVEGEETGGPALAIEPDGAILLRRPSPTRVWSLLAFSDPVRLDRTSRFALTEESLRRALAAGFDAEQVIVFLERQGGAPPPGGLGRRLSAWARGYRRVRLRRAVVVAPDDSEQREAIRSVLAARDLPAWDLADGRLLIDLPPEGDDDRSGERLVEALLREAAYVPQWPRPETR